MFSSIAFGIATLSTAHAHMGISTPSPLDQAAGDSYRYPVSSDNNPVNGGVCHGQTAGATYAWVWTPVQSGTCEIYQNCYTSRPGTLTMSGGAPHEGGPCALYSCPAGVTMPPCVRMQLPTSFGGCTQVVSQADCTLTGSFNGGGTNSGGGTPPPTPPVGGGGATPTKIRCGTSWNDADGKCGTLCTSDTQCTVAGEKCFADLTNCVNGNPSDYPTQEPGAGTGTCVSIDPDFTDEWCQSKQCAAAYKQFCEKGAVSQGGTVVECQQYATRPGQTWMDVALHWDVPMEELKAQNPDAPDDLVQNTMLEIPGDCAKPKDSEDGANAALRGAASLVVALAAAVLAVRV
jgi:hypothetical protein